MPDQIAAPNALISVEPLSQETFSRFGTVIQNPAKRPSDSPVSKLNVVSANQSTALKYLDVSHLTNHYTSCTQSAKAVVNMFVCSPRQLTPSSQTSSPTFPVQILERHPYTPQTFIPVGLSATDPSTTYLVIVAPTLPAPKGTNSPREAPYPRPPPRRRRSIKDIFSLARPSPFDDTAEPPNNQPSNKTSKTTLPEGATPKGPGLPDLSRIRAFVANGSQAVTYGPGTWHAPMVVLGQEAVDFVVVQYANGVALDDCQEVELTSRNGEEGLRVVLEEGDFGGRRTEKAKL